MNTYIHRIHLTQKANINHQAVISLDGLFQASPSSLDCKFIQSSLENYRVQKGMRAEKVCESSIRRPEK